MTVEYVIIGNGVASVGAIEAIRQHDKKGGITVFTDEEYPCYGRPLISYYLEGRAQPDNMNYRPKDFYKANMVDLHLSEPVTKLDAAAHTVTAGGKQYSYDKLLVATGSSPFVPPTPGYDTVKDKFTFIRMSDALALAKKVKKRSRVLIIGAGLTGLKCAEGLYPRAGHITVVDMAERVLPAVMDAEGANIVRKYLEGKGMEFHLGDSVAEYAGNVAHLKSGKDVEFDALVTAVGVRPNTALVAEAGGVTETVLPNGRTMRGIVTNDDRSTTLPDVYAAGDCSLSYDVTIEGVRPLAIQPNAYMQGETAGLAMCGAEVFKREYLPVNAGGFLGLHIITAGSYDGEAITIAEDGNYHRFFVKDGRLVGFIEIGNYPRAGILTDMIRKRTPVAKVDFASLIKSPSLGALGMDYVRAVLKK